MALNIPMPESPGSGFLKGLSTGGDLFHKMMLNQYYGQLHPSGDVANALYVEQLRAKYGDNDPRYVEAKRAHDTALAMRQSLMNYRDTLNQTAGIRATSPLGKIIAEGKGQGAMDILGGNKGAPRRPAGAVSKEGEQWYDAQGNPVYDEEEDTNPRTPEERQAYEQAIAKQTTDAAVRNKIPYAENVKITMDSINPDALVQYSGPQGHLRLGLEMLKAAKGEPSQDFMDYQSALTGAKTLAKQLRQFWGDSIQPAAIDRIEQLTNPSNWSKNPAIAKQQFMQLKAITDRELENFTRHGTSPVRLNYDKNSGQFYTGDKGQQNKSLESMVVGSAKKAPPVSQADRNMLNVFAGQVNDVLPKVTAENIIATHNATGKSIQEIMDHLASVASQLRGGQ